METNGFWKEVNHPPWIRSPSLVVGWLRPVEATELSRNLENGIIIFLYTQTGSIDRSVCVCVCALLMNIFCIKVSAAFFLFH